LGPGPDRDQAPVEVVERGERPSEVSVVCGQPGTLIVHVLAGTVDMLAGTGQLRQPASVDPAVEGRDGGSEVSMSGLTVVVTPGRLGDEGTCRTMVRT
jgi:hypothetical protein